MTPQELLKKMQEEVDIDGVLHNHNFNNYFGSFFEAYNDILTYDNGLSRLVIIPKEENYVLKINLSHYTSDEEDAVDMAEVEEADQKYYDTWYDDYEDKVYGVYINELGEDYSDTEVTIYEEAEEAGIGKFFAKEWYVGEICGHSCYAQEKAETYENSNEKVDFSFSKINVVELSKSIKKVGEKYDYFDHGIWLLFADYYGIEEYTKLVDFIIERGIGDLHNGNVGFKFGTNIPVLIDYADFNG